MEIDYIEFNSNGITVGPAVASNAETKFTPQTIELIGVRNRGQVYSPPKSHLGQPIDHVNPVTVANLATSFIGKKVLELKGMIGDF